MIKGKIIPRPFGHAIHANRPNQVIHYDFLYAAKPPISNGHRYQYLLVIMDDFSGFKELIPAENADHLVVVKALLHWFARFGVVPIHVSDRGSHFKNKVMEELAYRLDIKHHFCIPNLHRPNGTIECQNREILFVLRSLISEMKLSFHEWTDILSMVIWALNHCHQSSRGYPAVTLFTGLPPSRHLDVVSISKLLSI